MNEANGTALRPLSPIEEKAVQLRQRGIPDITITRETRLTPDQIAVAVKRHVEWTEIKSKSKPAVAVGMDHDELLAWADGSGLTRALTLAARIREGLVELRSIHRQLEARSRAQAEVDRLSAELEAARAALREAGGNKGDVRPAGTRPGPGRKQLLDAVRAWARDNGLDVAPLGRIPKNVQDAYHAAHRSPQ